MNPFQQKMIAVMNQSLEAGVALNALAHMCMGLGASLGPTDLLLMDYADKNENAHPNISKMPLIVLRANSNKIRATRQAAIENGIAFTDYLDTMIGGTWEEQAQNTRQKNDEELTYYGIMLFGKWETVSELTKKFSLWK
ncbi:DUF2000 domain-containing protein [Simkania negevensis]|uniref:DUF2000 domain-containing protein n=1 Tax=Simkania negevensis (strain ATCC VR-1471 / DSM 27360 / Z) TaxID=331113 RepID=F8L776_SIMNZ|nr:DUF2000 domain-containing protein [Simkania negevensis]CCB88591.1 putative uncharacterized protein [Simkania negevensis Z]